MLSLSSTMAFYRRIVILDNLIAVVAQNGGRKRCPEEHRGMKGFTA